MARESSSMPPSAAIVITDATEAQDAYAYVEPGDAQRRRPQRRGADQQPRLLGAQAAAPATGRHQRLRPVWRGGAGAGTAATHSAATQPLAARRSPA